MIISGASIHRSETWPPAGLDRAWLQPRRLAGVDS
jgi:hypothetical protein